MNNTEQEIIEFCQEEIESCKAMYKRDVTDCNTYLAGQLQGEIDGIKRVIDFINGDL